MLWAGLCFGQGGAVAQYVDTVFTRYLLLANIALTVCACRAEKQALDFE